MVQFGSAIPNLRVLQFLMSSCICSAASGTFGNLRHIENAMTFKATIVVLLRHKSLWKLLEQMEKKTFVLPIQDFRVHESFMFVFWVS